MRAGGVRRLELAGERPELGWDRDRSNRRAWLRFRVSGCLQSATPCPRYLAGGCVLRCVCTSVTRLCSRLFPRAYAVGIRGDQSPRISTANVRLTSYWVRRAWCSLLSEAACRLCHKVMQWRFEA